MAITWANGPFKRFGVTAQKLSMGLVALANGERLYECGHASPVVIHRGLRSTSSHSKPHLQRRRLRKRDCTSSKSPSYVLLYRGITHDKYNRLFLAIQYIYAIENSRLQIPQSSWYYYTYTYSMSLVASKASSWQGGFI